MRRDANEATGVKDEGKDQEKEYKEYGKARPNGCGSGQVIGEANGEEGEREVFLGLGLLGCGSIIVVVR